MYLQTANYARTFESDFQAVYPKSYQKDKAPEGDDLSFDPKWEEPVCPAVSESSQTDPLLDEVLHKTNEHIHLLSEV